MANNSGNSLKGQPVQRFLNLLDLERREIAHVYLYAILNGLLYLSIPLGIQAIIGLVLANQLSSSWTLMVAVVTLGTLFMGGLQLMQISITEMIQQKIFARSAFEFSFRFPRIKTEALSKYYPPELVNRFFDTLTLQKGLPKLLIDFSTASLQIVFGLILLSFYHSFFVFFGFVLMGTLFLIFRYTGPRGMKTSLQESDHKYQVVYWLEEIARTLSSFKLAGATKLALTKSDKLVTNYLHARKEHFKVLILQYKFIIIFKTAVVAGLLIIGSILLIRQQLNLGQFVASEIVIILVINSVEKLILSMETLYDVLTAVEKIGKVTDLPLERHGGYDFEDLDNGQGVELKVQDLNFTYPGKAERSLKDISFTVQPGQKVCITGVQGAGKSILLDVLAGLYESYDGVIAFNGMPLENIDRISYHHHLGDSLGHKDLFHGTIYENLTIGKEDVNLKDVLWALERLNLSDYVQSQPKGLDTVIVPEDLSLSYAVSRKLILARSLINRPQLLVIDNFFHALGIKDRQAVYDFLICDELNTVIAVSNDRYFASRCDLVIVMNEGSIQEAGSYEELIHKPYFHNLFL